jgi:hypothetical protein
VPQGRKFWRKPGCGQKKFTIHHRPSRPRTALPVGVPQHDSNLTGVHFPKASVILATGTRTSQTVFLVGTLVQDQKTALPQLGRGAYVFLNALIHSLPGPGRIRHEVLHRLPILRFKCSGFRREISTCLHRQQTPHVLLSMLTGIPGACGETFTKPFPMPMQLFRKGFNAFQWQSPALWIKQVFSSCSFVNTYHILGKCGIVKLIIIMIFCPRIQRPIMMPGACTPEE